MNNLQEKRRRFLRKRCPIVTVCESLFHGSPLDGLEAIRQCGKLIPQEHGELTINTFCVSPNDNMLQFFSDGEGVSGLCFDPVPLQCLHLDWFHYHLLSEYKAKPDAGQWPTREHDEEIIAEKLGYWNYGSRELEIRPDDFLEILPPGIDAILFPWQTFKPYFSQFELHWPNWNTEAEVSLLEPGCKKIWNSINQIILSGEEFDKSDGWNQIRRRYLKSLKNQAA